MTMGYGLAPVPATVSELIDAVDVLAQAGVFVLPSHVEHKILEARRTPVWLIEFRNGSYFQSLSAERGGRAETAQRFRVEEAARAFMRQHEWILWNGGMAVRFDDLPPPTPNGIRVVHGDARLRGLDLRHISGRRWRTATSEPTRVRVCRGSRR